MSTLKWKSAASGDFNDATRWDTGHAPGAGDIVNVGLAGSYTVTVDTADTAGTINFSAAGATLMETGAGSLTLDILKLSAGTVVLQNANTIGNYIFQTGGQLQFSNSNALGTATDFLSAGEQTALASATIANNLSLFQGGTTATIDAAAGQTLDIGSGGWTLNDAGIPTLQFGSATETGTVIWHSASGTVTGGGGYKVNVAGGTLQAGDSSFSSFTTNANNTTVAAGATLDVAGNDLMIHNLLGAGSVIDNGTANLDLMGANFSGTIGGDLLVVVFNDVVLSGINTYVFGTEVEAGAVLGISNGGALGAGTLNLGGGELLATADVSLSNHTGFFNADTVAAATGHTLTLASPNMDWEGNSTAFSVTFGDATHKGTVVLAPVAETEEDAGQINVTVADGTLQFGNANTNANSLLDGIDTITVAAGATVDVNGNNFDSNAIVIAGMLTNSSATNATFESLVSSTVSGRITGNLSVEVGGGTMTLTGANTYTNGTTIVGGAELDLGNGGAGGSILAGSTIADNGLLVDNHSSNENLSGTIFGNGSFTKNGTGATTLSGVNTYSGGTTLNSGELIVTNSGSLGASSGTVAVTGGELLAGATVSLAQSMTFTGSPTVAAATGQTLTLDTASMNWDGSTAPLHVTFGDAAHKGTVLFGPTGGGLNPTNPLTVTVADGTLKLASSGDVYFDFGPWTVAAGATLDANGTLLLGGSAVIAGTLTNSSGTAATFESAGSTAVSGAITGNLDVLVDNGTTTLTGTNSYTGGTFINPTMELDLGNGGAGGTILADSAIDDEGLLVDNHSSSQTLSGVISDSGGFTKSGTGTTTLSGVNTYSGGTTLNSGTLIATNNASLGTGTINLKGGELLTNTDITFAQSVTFSGSTTVAAATNTTLTLASNRMIWDDSTAPVSITFGDVTHKGTIVLDPASDGPVFGQPVAVTVADGILRLGSSAASDLFSGASVTVGAAARLDLRGFEFAPVATTITGILTNTVATAAEFESHGTSTASGSINGNLDLLVYSGSMTLTGANTYTGGTTIDSGATLNLGNGGTGGSLLAGSAIVDNGVLTDNQSSTDTLSGIISGTGKFNKSGTGTTTLSGANTYSGGTALTAGELVVTNIQSLGSGALTMSGGELLATASMTQSHVLHTSGTDTIAAAHGTNFVLSATSATIGAGKLIIGDSAGHDGTFSFHDSGALTISDAAHTTVEVQAGTLIAGSDGALSTLLKGIAGTAIDSGATLDETGHALSITALTGTGTLTDSGAGVVTSLFGATNFAGAITGATTVDVFANTALTGNESFTGALNIE
ncbi:MAG TPA: autotransporter-associated beta strand repeat-containing protein, partial [Rhizomicrobium sp.]